MSDHLGVSEQPVSTLFGVDCLSQPEFATRIERMDLDALGKLLAFANTVQAWSFRGTRRTPRYGTFAQAAHSLGVSVEQIAMAVEAHYWMYADDPDAPIGQRRIEHEGE